MVNGSQDPSLPRVYEDPDEVAASNQVKRKHHKEIGSMQYLTWLWTTQMVVDVPIVVEIRYEIGRIIGDGNFAVVREGIDRLVIHLFSLSVICIF